MVLILTGNGKGKTTSAIGTAIRGIGWGKKVAIVFFDKGGSHYGEQNIFDLLQEKITVHRFGQQRFDEKTQQFRYENTEEDKKEAEQALKKTLELCDQNYFLIIADELINCLNSGLVDESSVRQLIDKCPKETHLMLTGRGAPDWLIEKADLVSETKEIKHYLNPETSSGGKQAIKGLDY